MDIKNLVVVCGIAVLASSGGCYDSRQTPSPGTVTRVSTSIIKFPTKTLRFETSRDDINVGRVTFSVFSSSPETLLVDGYKPKPHQIATKPPQTYIYKFASRVSHDLFELPPTTIEFDEGDHVCMSVKASFDHVTNQYDSLYYQNIDDRYALVSYCTTNRSEGNARFSQNRVRTLEEFTAVMSRRFFIRLNQRSLPTSGNNR